MKKKPDLKPQVIKEDGHWVLGIFPIGPGTVVIFLVMLLLIIVGFSAAEVNLKRYRDADSKIECYKGIQQCDKDIRAIQEKIIADKDKKINELRKALARTSKVVQNGEVILYMERK